MTQKMQIGLEVKAMAGREFEGYGSIFGNIDLGGDIVVPGSFRKSLAAHQKAGTLPQMFWMHDPAQVPGRWVEMREDEKGLFVRGELANTQLGNEMQTLLKMKAVRGLSIGYSANDIDYDNDGNRLLKDNDLWEVSLVSLAMNPLAQVEAMKSRLSRDGEYVPTEREFERLMRERMGVSKKTARTLTARVFDTDAGGMPDHPRRDAGDVDPDAAALLKALESRTDKLWSEVFRK